MKHILVVSALLSTKLFASTLVMPATMDAGSVQAKLKAVLYERLEANGPVTDPYSARLTGSYGEVKLEDQDSKIICQEFSHHSLAVQMFQCEVTLNDGLGTQVSQVALPETLSSNSVQATLKEILFAELEAHGPVTDPYQANLTGNYSQVTLEDASHQVVCTEGSKSPLPVQAFFCDFVAKK